MHLVGIAYMGHITRIGLEYLVVINLKRTFGMDSVGCHMDYGSLSGGYTKRFNLV